MDVLFFFNYLSYLLAIPTAFILLGTALFFTISMKGIQFRSLPRFFSLITDIVFRPDSNHKTNAINPFHALFTALSTSLGMGTIVGPSIAIVMGGPGALFWMLFYAICGSVTKFSEVTFALHFREKTREGKILGGPMQYLQKVHPLLGRWYTYATIFLFAAWSGLQANVLSETLAHQFVPPWVTGLCLAGLVFFLLGGGAQRVGVFNSRLVPFMFVLYVSASAFILLSHLSALKEAFILIGTHIFMPTPAISGFIGASVYTALRAGVYKGAFTTESGMGTSSIPHSMADVSHPTDQGVLAMTSVFVDTFLCLLSGLLILVSGIWQKGIISNTMIYQVFDSYLPNFGRPILVFSISMFILGTVIGNSFNGRQSFASVTHYRFLSWYNLTICCILFVSTIIEAPLAWAIADTILPLVAIPNVVGLIYLSFKYPHVLRNTYRTNVD